jgi:hypothetical protein
MHAINQYQDFFIIYLESQLSTKEPKTCTSPFLIFWVWGVSDTSGFDADDDRSL